jgi:hypothetical protein
MVAPVLKYVRECNHPELQRIFSQTVNPLILALRLEPSHVCVNQRVEPLSFGGVHNQRGTSAQTLNTSAHHTHG